MEKFSQLLRPLCITMSLAFVGSGLTLSSEAFATPSQETCARKSKKSKKRKLRRKRRAKRRANKKISRKSIYRWWKAGQSNDKILAKARKAGYVPSKKDLVVLKKRRVSRNLLVSLVNLRKPAAQQATRKPVKKIDFKTIHSDSDIDFDSVAPPQGMPGWAGKEQRKPRKKVLDQSLRPSAPFKPTKSGKKTENSGKRRVVMASGS